MMLQEHNLNVRTHDINMCQIVKMSIAFLKLMPKTWNSLAGHLKDIYVNAFKCVPRNFILCPLRLFEFIYIYILSYGIKCFTSSML